MFSKALSKSPTDRYDTCTEFANALAQRLGLVAAETGATAATTASPIAARAKHRPRPQRAAKERSPRRLVIVAAVLALLLIGVSAVAFLLFRQDRDMTASPQRTPTPASSAPAPTVPVVLLGADCATLGAAGVTSTGAQAYCSRIASTGDSAWSLYTGTVTTPASATPGPTDEVYPAGIEEQVRICVEETGKTRLQCREDVRRGNITGPA